MANHPTSDELLLGFRARTYAAHARLSIALRQCSAGDEAAMADAVAAVLELERMGWNVEIGADDVRLVIDPEAAFSSILQHAGYAAERVEAGDRGHGVAALNEAAIELGQVAPLLRRSRAAVNAAVQLVDQARSFARAGVGLVRVGIGIAPYDCAYGLRIMRDGMSDLWLAARTYRRSLAARMHGLLWRTLGK